MRLSIISAPVIVLLCLAGSVKGANNFGFSCRTGGSWDDWKPEPRENLGLFGHLYIYQPGFPSMHDLSIRELYFKTTGSLRFGRIQAEAGYERIGDLGKYTYSSSAVEYEYYYQRYRYTNPWNSSDSKNFWLYLTVVYYANSLAGNDPGHPTVLVKARIYWPAGVPQRYEYETPEIKQAGMWVRMDWDPASSASNSAEEHAQEDYLSVVYPWYPEFDATKWGNTLNKAVARFYDVTWRSRTSELADIWWMREAYDQDYQIQVGKYSPGGSFYHFSDGAVSGQQEAIDKSKTATCCPTAVPRYVPASNGMDQVIVMYTGEQGQNHSSPSTADLSLYIQKNYGMRSLHVDWFYHDDAYRDIARKVNRGGVNNSVVDALADMMYWASSHQHNSLSVVNSKKTLTCPGGVCSKAELIALETSLNSGTTHRLGRLNSAAYILSNTQGHEHDLPGAKYGGIVYSGASRAFVFPKNCPSTDEVYLTICHEIGHTLGMNHQWSQCDKGDDWDGNCPGGFNCNGGTIMSYSTNRVMKFHEDARRWFAEAPLNWVHPRWGFGAVASETIEPKSLIDWVSW